MATRLPFVLDPNLDMATGFDFIEEIIGHMRRQHQVPRTMRTRASDRATSDDRPGTFVVPSDGSRRRERRELVTKPKGGRNQQPPRTRYSLAPVRDGHNIQIKGGSPSTTIVMDYLRKHPGQLLAEIAAGTKLSPNTVSNQFTILRKNEALRTEDAANG